MGDLCARHWTSYASEQLHHSCLPTSPFHVQFFAPAAALLLSVSLVGCDATVENDISIGGEWTGQTVGTRIVNSDTLTESVSLEVRYQEAEDGELTGTGVFVVSSPNREDETVELDVTGLRSSNTVESAFVNETDTVVYNGSIRENGNQIEGQWDWKHRHEGTARVVLERE